MTDSSPSTPVLIESFRLVPVIEVEPYRYSKTERELPDGLGREPPAAWAAYWRACLAESGITGLQPLQEGSWHESTTAFSTENQQVLNNVLVGYWRGYDETAKDLTLLETAPLYGGMALVDASGKVWLEPACCSDLGNLSSWADVAITPPMDWAMLWIGHPWVHVRAHHDNLVFGNETESSAPANEVFMVSIEWLRSEVLQARTELTRFASLVEKSLAVYECAGDLAKVARFLSGISGREDEP